MQVPSMFTAEVAVFKTSKLAADHTLKNSMKVVTTLFNMDPFTVQDQSR